MPEMQKNQRTKQCISSWMITSLPEYGQNRTDTFQCCSDSSTCWHRILACIRISQSHCKSITIIVSTGLVHIGRCMVSMWFLRSVGVIRNHLNGVSMENLSVVAVSSVGTQNNKEKKRCFLDGYHEMVERLQPTQIIFYGRVPDECKKNIIHIKQFSEKWHEAEVSQW